ncbi:hydroxyacid dehydrogenase [Mahella australiensis]|uniref:Phosphoglycerate dehydrogenase n=1 Tax=Mahella australiensis (strain DSM 15567 / CIP 107919 / 50-1 BON) TaxID=697281 RepID=F3ZWR2_MAHA5|nr:hydroxyacid dehydrogenase [Mahella australiensis]AEE96505.1 Phosphoglycerate dehydrogenase [Mahella australiensis 50-1 BON]
MEKVLLPERIIDEGLELLKDKAEIIITKDASEQSIIDEVSDTFAIILRSKAKITRSIIEAAPKLKVISRTGAGYDNVDVQAATEHNVMVCNLPGINTVAVAEHTISLMLALLKQLPKMDLYVRNGQWGKRSEFISEEAFGKTIGIVGLGKIGREVMFRCKSMGMHVLVYDPYVENALKDNDIRFCNDVETLFTQSDVITLHVPNIPENKKMVDEHLIRLMKPTAYIINTSRGEVIDQGALTSALKEHRIAGAGLDVFAQEPIEQDDPLLTLDNVILTPHAAALTKESGIKMTVEAVKQVIDCLEGRIPPYIVNRRELHLE